MGQGRLRMAYALIIMAGADYSGEVSGSGRGRKSERGHPLAAPSKGHEQNTRKLRDKPFAPSILGSDHVMPL